MSTGAAAPTAPNWLSAAVIERWKPKNSARILRMSVLVDRYGRTVSWLARSMSSSAFWLSG